MADKKQGSRITGGNSEYGRVESDYYPTPKEATIALLNNIEINPKSIIWEPACGEGYISRVLLEKGFSVISTDLNDQGYGEGGVDFLTADTRPCDWIITNPPFSIAEDFIMRCHRTRKPFALLLKSHYWHAKKRYGLFFNTKPSVILPMTWRPDFMEKKRGSGSPLLDCIWCVWYGDGRDTTYKPILKPTLN
jgi:hypothetical protein